MKRLFQLLAMLLCSGLASTAQSTTTVNVPTIDNTFDPNAGYRGSPVQYNDTLFVRAWSNPKNVLARYNETGNTLSAIPLPPGVLGYVGSPIVYGTSLYGLYAGSSSTVLAKYNNGTYTVVANPDNGSGLRTEVPPIEYQGSLYFSYKRADNKFALAKFDGSNLTLIANPDNNGGFASIYKFIISNARLYFAYANPNGLQLAEYNGTAITLYNNPDNGPGIAGEYVAYNGNLYFNYQNLSNQHLLAKFNGTAVSLIPNTPANAVGVAGDPIVYNNTLCYSFSPNTSGSSRLLAVYNGSNVIYNPNPDNASNGMDFGGFTVFNGALYGAYWTDPGPVKLFKYDGTTLSLVSDPAYPDYNYSGAGPVFNNKLIVRAAFPPTYTKTNLAYFDGVKFEVINNARPADPGPMDVDKGIVFHNKFFFRNDSLALFFTIPNLAYVGAPVSAITKKDATCNGANDGWAKATPPPCGAGSNTFLWTPGNQTTDSIGGLAPGTYSVRIICGVDTLTQSVVIDAGAGPSAPAATNQSLCNGARVADLSATASGGNTIKWYATPTGGTPLANSTQLVDGTRYYAAQVTPANCESNSRAVDSVTILATIVARGDSSYCSGSNIGVNFAGATGNTYTWTATQHGSGIAASGTGNTNFTGINTSNAVITDTITVSAAYTAPSSYTVSDGVYAFADTTGSTYLNMGTTYSSGNLSSSIPIGFNFNFFGTNYSSIYISNLGSITFDAAATKLVYGQLRGWTTDATSQIAYKLTGPAPNRKLIVSFINLNKPNDVNTTVPFGPPINTTYTADPVTGRGTFQIVLNETSNTIESLKQSVPALTAFTIPIGMGPAGNVSGNYEGVKNGAAEFYVSGRNNGDWLKLSNESKIFTPVAGINCAGQKDTFLIAVLPLPKVDSVSDVQVCPGGNVHGISFTSPITGGTVEYKWTSSNKSFGLAASGTGNLPSFTAAGTGATTVTVQPYMLKSATDTCFGTARTFTITAGMPPAPGTTGNLVVYTGNKTLSQLDIKPLAGGTINFYSALSGGTPLAGSAGVVDDTTYYITQTINGCESTPRKAIVVNRIANDSAVNCAPSTLADLVASPRSGNTARWYNVPTAGTALAGNTALQAGQDTLYVEEGSIKTDTLLTRNGGSFVDFFDALTHDENDTLYMGTFGSGKVYKANPDGSNLTELFAGNGNIRSLYYKKEGVNRFLYYLEDGSDGVRKRNLVTGATTTIGSGLFWSTEMVFDDASGAVFVADRENSKLKKIDPATNAVYVIDSFITKPFVDYNRIFGVAYNPATHTIFFNNFDKGKVYAKDLNGTHARVEILSTSQPTAISLLANGKLLITTSAGSILTCNQDGSSPVTLKTGLYEPAGAFFNNNDELTYNYVNTVNKEANNQSNRTPVTVIVNPSPMVIPNGDQVVCNNSAVAAINFGTNTTGATVNYAWTNDNTGIGLAASGSGNIPSFTGINNGNTPDTARVIVTPMVNSAGMTCVGVKDTFYLVVNPIPNVNAIASQVLCNNSTTAPVNFTSSVTGSGVVYSWTNSNANIGLAATGTGNIASFTATNSSNAPITATITVTASYSNAGVNCQGNAQTFTITVNPTATVNAINNQAACNGSNQGVINFSSPTTGGTVTYNWTNSNTSIGLAASGTGNIASFTAINTSNAPVTATITVTPSFSNGAVVCAGTPNTFTITVNPTTKANAVANQTVCAGSVNNAASFGSPVAGTSYSWTNSDPSIGLAASGTGNVPSFTAVNPNPTAVVATITVTPTTAAGCAGQPISYTITVNGLSVAPTAIINPAPIVCANDPIGTLTVSGGALGSGAAWKWYADNTNGTSIGSGSTLSNIPVAKTTTYFVRAEGTCNTTTSVSSVVQKADLVYHVQQHWGDVLLFDNSSKQFVAWQWYKNGQAVAGATMQQYSENSALSGSYYVIATDVNGVKSMSCPLVITAGSFKGLSINLYPNPADKGANLTVSTSFTAGELQGATLIVTDVYGRIVKQLTQVLPVSTLQAPSATGMYIVTLTLQNGRKFSANLLTK